MRRYILNLFSAIAGHAPNGNEMKEAAEQLKKDALIIGDYQRLVENLRERVKELLQQREEETRNVGKLVMSRNLLEKTNNGLSDICQQMEAGNTEGLRSMTESLSWSNHLNRIVQRHLSVVQRCKDLEEILFASRRHKDENLL